MVKTFFVLSAIALIIALIWVIPALTTLRYQRLKRQPLPPGWIAILEQIPLYGRLPLSLQKRLHGHIRIFLAQKQFIGCRGVQITDEIKLIIAAQACLLLLNERGEYYPKLASILVYPSAYVANQTVAISPYVMEERKVSRLGESWAKDQVVLSWEQIQRDLSSWQDGRNVILHEFAHQLDQEDGKADGVPILSSHSDYETWAQVFSQEYQQLLIAVQRGRKTVLDEYGATAPAEFFAVATETFFEKPRQLHSKHPALYQELKRYYRLDPLEWLK